MSCYKESKYNNYMCEHDKLFIVNTLSKKKLYIGAKEEFPKSLHEVSEVSQDELVRLGFLIDKNFDEASLVKYEGNNIIFGKESLNLTIIPTVDCNLRCVYCYQVHEHCYMSDEVFSSIILFLKKNLRYYKVLNIDWFGGEPLISYKKISKFMNEVINLCKQYRVALISSMTTNGFLLNERILNEMIQSRILFFQITIDGTQEIHDKQRPLVNGQGSYNKILNNLKLIRDTCKSTRLRILIRLNAGQTILPYIEEYLMTMGNEFSDDERFLFEIAKISDWGGDNSELIHNEMVQQNSVNDMNELLTRFGLHRPTLNLHYGQGVICDACKSSGYIFDYDGSIKKCSIAMGSEDEFIKKINNIGTINSDGSLEINKYHESFWVKGDNLFEEKCTSCLLFPSCYGTGCRYRELEGIHTSEKIEECNWSSMYFGNS